MELSSQLLHKVLFENVCHLETLVFETVSRLSSSSHLSKGKLAPMVLPLDIPWCPVFLGIGIYPQRIPGYPCRWHVTLGILSPQVRIILTNPNKLKHVFQTRFSKCLATVSHLLEPWFLNPVTWQLQTSTTSLVISPTLYGKVLVAIDFAKRWTSSYGYPPNPTCCALGFKPFRR